MKRFLLINAGLVLIAIALHLFLIPQDLAVGGVSGLGMIIKKYIPSMNIGVVMLILNFILFIFAYFLIGREFMGYTLYSSFALSVMTGLLERFIPAQNYFPDDILINLIFGIVIQGLGMAIIFYQNASTGGTDIIAKIINKYTKVDIGKSLFLSDFLITLGAAVSFSPRLGMYAFLGIMINTVVIDKVISGFESKVKAQIISNHPEKVVEYIENVLDRGSTYLLGMGTYSKEQKRIVVVILSRREYLQLRYYIKQMEPTAFITMNYVHEVLGEGFD